MVCFVDFWRATLGTFFRMERRVPKGAVARKELIVFVLFMGLGGYWWFGWVLLTGLEGSVCGVFLSN